MSKVWMVTEHWDNCRGYEDHEHFDRTIGLCISKDVANRVIERRINGIVEGCTDDEVKYDAPELMRYDRSVQMMTLDWIEHKYVPEQYYAWIISEENVLES